ncbi:hypothetical protein ACHAXS_002461 [Conticribra weissflogii]
MGDNSSNLSTGKWTALECKQFEEGVIEHGWGNWTAVNEMIPTRKRSQVKSRAQKIALFRPNEKNKLEIMHVRRTLEQYWAFNDWTKEERARFERAVALRGWGKWCDIARKILDQRNEVSTSASSCSRKLLPEINIEAAAAADCKKREAPEVASFKIPVTESKKRKTAENGDHKTRNASSATTRESSEPTSARETVARAASTESKFYTWMDEVVITVYSRNNLEGVDTNEDNAWRIITGQEINDLSSCYDCETDDEFVYKIQHSGQTEADMAPANGSTQVNDISARKKDILAGLSLGVALGVALSKALN